MKNLLFATLLLCYASAAYAGTETPIYLLYKPATNESGWANSMNLNLDKIETALERMVKKDTAQTMTQPLTVPSLISNGAISGTTGSFTGNVSALTFTEGGSLLSAIYLNKNSGVAYDSSRLGGVLAANYAQQNWVSSNFVGVGGTAYNSDRLGGVAAASYATQSWANSTFLSLATAATTYLKLDGSNSPLTGDVTQSKANPRLIQNRTSGQYSLTEYRDGGTTKSYIGHDYTNNRVGLFDSTAAVKAYYDLTGNRFVSAGALESSQFIYLGSGTSIYSNTTDSLRTDDAFSAQSLVSSTSVSAASISSSGAVSGASVSATGAVSGASVSATGAVSGSTLSSSVSTGTPPISVVSTTKVVGLNVDTVDDLTTGNASGNIPVSNGTLNTNLNAEKLSGSTKANLDSQYIDVAGDTMTGTLNSRAITPTVHDTYDIGSSISTAYRNGYFGTLYEAGSSLGAKYVDVAGDTLTGTLNTRALTPSATATYDIGASTASAYKDGYFSGNLYEGGSSLTSKYVNAAGDTGITGRLVSSGTSAAFQAMLEVTNAASSAQAIKGTATNSGGYGVLGIGVGAGIIGQPNASTPSAHGVYGEHGVASASGSAVYGYIYGGSNTGSGVRGDNVGASNTGYGIYGKNGASTGTGVFGENTAGGLAMHALSTGTQLKLSYDGTKSATFAVDSLGNLTIDPTGSYTYLFSPVRVGGHVTPGFANTDIGSSSDKFRDGYFSGSITEGAQQLSAKYAASSHTHAEASWTAITPMNGYVNAAGGYPPFSYKVEPGRGTWVRGGVDTSSSAAVLMGNIGAGNAPGSQSWVLIDCRGSYSTYLTIHTNGDVQIQTRLNGITQAHSFNYINNPMHFSVFFPKN